MTRRIFGLLLSSAALVPSRAFGQDTAVSGTLTDGDSWNAANVLQKHWYIVGFADAASDAYVVVGSRLCDAANSQDRKLRTISQESFDLTNIKFNQLVDGLDTFYGDYRNRAIQWKTALGYVRDTIHGKSKEALERELDFMRKMAVSDAEKK
jgi:hypothetical protein